MRTTLSLLVLISCTIVASAQSPSFETYVNPVIPGDHPDATLTRIGDFFYTTGSSFNPTPKIYRSTDLVRWEAIAQPIAASWPQYGDAPAGGAWGGHMVLYNDVFWHFFGLGANMWFVQAPAPEGPWGTPTRMNVPAGVPGLGRDNSIFIDDDGRWFLLVKNGEEINYIVELGPNGQPAGDVLDLTWLNPAAENYPYAWAEGPVMWKRDGTYYYSFAQHLAGNQYVMRSDTLTDNEEDWTILGNLFENVPDRSGRIFRDPNHSSPAVMADDGTSWIISQAYWGGINSEWMAQGRQGVLSQITYDESGRPTAVFPMNGPEPAPKLPSSGIGWAVPKSDMFDASTLHPEWSFLGYTPDDTHSLTERPGWLRLRPYQGQNTVIKNDGEHSYSLITRLYFSPESPTHEAGLWVFNGLETMFARLYSTVNAEGEGVVRFSFEGVSHSAENTVGDVLWLKIERNNHVLTGFFSDDGHDWVQVGNPISVTAMDRNQPDFNAFTGNQQGPYVRGKAADFDLYIYRDAYSIIRAQYPINYNGVLRGGTSLRAISNGDWSMYAGVEFGTESPSEDALDYQRSPAELTITAASATSGGIVEAWLDSIDTGQKIGEVVIESTGAWTTFNEFTAPVDSISGRHDLYLRFVGNEGDELFRLQSLQFTPRRMVDTSTRERAGNELPGDFTLHQNHPNPFNPSTHIRYDVPTPGHVTLSVYNALGQQVATLVDDVRPAGSHSVHFDGSDLATGVYLYRLHSGKQVETRTMVLVR